MEETCKITIPEGFGVGYKKHSIASASAEIELADGTHYLLARNGRGKTTLLRTIAGSLDSIFGSSQVLGKIQYVPEDIEYDDHLSAEVILKTLVPQSRRSECLAFAEKVELEVKKNYRDLSTGNKRKISWLMAEFCCELGVGNVLLLDEPFTGLDSYVRQAFMEYWEENQDGICRLVSCHPDFDSMAINSAVLISDEKITASNSSAGQSWGNLKEGLK